MKIHKLDLKTALFFGIYFMLISCSHTKNDELPAPSIASGIAKLSGVISNYRFENGDTQPTLTLLVPHPITAENGNYVTNISRDGTFSFEVPIECDTTICILMSALFDRSIHVSMTANSVTKLQIILEETGKTGEVISNMNKLTSSDMTHLYDVMGKMIAHVSPEHIPRYNMLIEDFIPFEIKSLERKLSIATDDSILTNPAKRYISNEFKLIYLNVRFLDYKGIMKTDFMRYNDMKDWDNFTAREPDKSYYALLKYFNLNDPQYLYNPTYPDVLQNLLSNKTLNIPPIKDMPIEDWLKEVKSIMTDMIGTDTGLFYDLLAANAYSRQFNIEVEPLSETQKANINGYFKNKEIAKILLKKNEEIMKLDEEKRRTITIINKTPAVPKEDIMDAIISKYIGKVVLVDFWATWCQPCMDAMKANKLVRNEFLDKNVAFVYITNVSSPMELWKEKIQMLGGDQYYLTKDEFNYIMESFGFTGIPTYLFYNTKGEMKNKITGYPGAEKMQKMIESLLL